MATVYADLLNQTEQITDIVDITTSLELDYVSPNNVLVTDTNSVVNGIGLLDGQLVIGRSAGAPSAAYITGTVNQVGVTNGPNSITLSTPQDIGTSSNVTFASVTAQQIIDNGLTASRLVATDASKQLQSVTITNANGTNISFAGSTLAATMTQNLQTTGSPSFQALTLTNTSNQMTLGTINTVTINAAAPTSNRTITFEDVLNANNTVAYLNGTQTVTGTKFFTARPRLAATGNQLLFQQGGTGNTIDLIMSSPAANRVYTLPDATANANFVMSEGASTINGVRTFGSNPIFNAATASTALRLNSSKALESVTLTNGQLLIGSTGNPPQAATVTGTTNQINVTNGAGTITLSTPQDIATTSSPSFDTLQLTAALSTIWFSGESPMSFVSIDNNRRLRTSGGGANLDGYLAIGNSVSKFATAGPISGTANQITVTNGPGSITLSTPQDIATSSSPTFASLTLSNLTNQLTLGTTTTINAPTTLASRTYTIEDCNANAYFVLTENFGIQTINGSKFFNDITCAGLSLNNDPSTENYTVLQRTNPAANRTYNFPDVGANSDVALLVGSQTFSGTKTFSSSPVVSSLTANGIVTLNGSSTLSSSVLTNGQLLIGRTGNTPLAATLTGTSNQITVTDASGSITLSTPQNIATTSTPTFANVIQNNNCFIRATSSTSVTNSSFTVLSLTSVVLQDPSSMFDGTNKFTLGTAKYMAVANFRLQDGAGTDTTGIQLWINGSLYATAEAFFAVDGGGRRCATLQYMVSATSGDYLQIAAFQSSGSSKSVTYVNASIQRLN